MTSGVPLTADSGPEGTGAPLLDVIECPFVVSPLPTERSELWAG